MGGAAVSRFFENRTFRVVQTIETFGYPRGKVWGPYATLELAEKRLKRLHEFKGNGVIEEGDYGRPCRTHHPEIANY